MTDTGGDATLKERLGGVDLHAPLLPRFPLRFSQPKKCNSNTKLHEKNECHKFPYFLRRGGTIVPGWLFDFGFWIADFRLV